MGAYEAVYGTILAVLLVIKHFGQREMDTGAVRLILLGMAVLLGAGLLAALVGLGSAVGASVIGSLGAVGSGACLLIGLYYELLGRPEPPPRREVVRPEPPTRAAAPQAAPNVARPQARPPARPAAPAPRPAPRPAAPPPEDDETEE